MARMIYIIATTALLLHIGSLLCEAQTNSIELITYPDRNIAPTIGIVIPPLIERQGIHFQPTEEFFFDRIGGVLRKPESGPSPQNFSFQETKQKFKKRGNKGFILGASIGFVVGATLGYVGQKWACSYSERDDCDISTSTIIGFGIVGVIPGAIIGVILGNREFNATQAGLSHTQFFYQKHHWILTHQFYF